MIPRALRSPLAYHAEVLMLKRVMEEKGSKGLLVLPYVALVQEKVRWLRSMVDGLRYPPCQEQDDPSRVWRKRADEDTVRVVGFFGGGKVRATWHDFDIGVCTMEKVRDNPSIQACTKNTRPTPWSIRPLKSAPFPSCDAWYWTSCT